MYIFKISHHPDYRLDAQEKLIKVVRATSAAPTFFRPLEDGQFTFVDSGVWSNNPVVVGLVDVMTCYQVPRERARQILSSLRARVLYVCRELNNDPRKEFLTHDTRALVKLIELFNRVHDLDWNFTKVEILFRRFAHRLNNS